MILEKCPGIFRLSNGGYRIFVGLFFCRLRVLGETNGMFDLYSVYGRLGGGDMGQNFGP